MPAGVYVNTLLAGALVTTNGVNPASAIATLTVLAINLLGDGLRDTLDPRMSKRL